jgi:histidinol-phosphate aminotransferase
MNEGPQPRAGLRSIEPYVSPQLDVPVRLNTNECPRPLPEGFADELSRLVRELPLNRYPDGQMTRLREAIAERAGHTLAGTWAANGSNEILEQLLLAYGGLGHKAVAYEPTYALHSRIAWLTQTEVLTFRLHEPFTIGARDVAAATSLHPNVAFVCSPNNPTGNAQPVEAVQSLARDGATLVIVDEAYIEFGGESALPLVADNPNVVVVRTLSKAFALAGARIGYCLGSEDVVGDLQRVRLPYHLSQLAQAAGFAALKHADEAAAILDDIRAQRDRIAEALGAVDGVTVFPSDANFVLFKPPAGRAAKDVWQALLERGVLIRDLTAVVPEGLRVSAGTAEEVDRFLEAIGEVLAA